MLAVGFGEAGSEIVSSNIRQAGEFNLNLKGERVLAIFGFCDIRNFTDTTEILQTKVMVYVNHIAEIVHS